MNGYIAMAGLHGCMCSYVAEHESYEDAVEDLAGLHDLSKRQEQELRKNGYLELDLHKHGNEYCEITEGEFEEEEE